MGKSFGFRFLALAAVLIIVAIIQVQSAGIGTVACVKGQWVPDAKLDSLSLTCRPPLDGTTKSKGKTLSCLFKKLEILDGTSVKQDKIPGAACPVFSDAHLQKKCQHKVQSCLKEGKGYFRSRKDDKEYKSWGTPYDCFKAWVDKACKK